MLHYLLVILGLALLCALWVIIQRWIARQMPEAPGVEGRQGSCRGTRSAPPTEACEACEETCT